MLGILIILLLALISGFLVSRSSETTVQQDKVEDILSALPQSQDE